MGSHNYDFVNAQSGTKMMSTQADMIAYSLLNYLEDYYQTEGIRNQ